MLGDRAEARRQPVGTGAVAAGGREPAAARLRTRTSAPRAPMYWCEPEGGRDVTLIGTGSELALATEAAKTLAKEGMRAAVVSMPSMELFRAQPESYRAKVLGEWPARRRRGRHRPVLVRMARRQGPLRRPVATSAPRRPRRSSTRISVSRPMPSPRRRVASSRSEPRQHGPHQAQADLRRGRVGQACSGARRSQRAGRRRQGVGRDAPRAHSRRPQGSRARATPASSSSRISGAPKAPPTRR